MQKLLVDGTSGLQDIMPAEGGVAPALLLSCSGMSKQGTSMQDPVCLSTSTVAKDVLLLLHQSQNIGCLLHHKGHDVPGNAGRQTALDRSTVQGVTAFLGFFLGQQNMLLCQTKQHDLMRSPDQHA